MTTMKLFHLLLLFVVPVVNATFYHADDENFVYAGRWVVEDRFARADWPCSGVHFAVTGGASSIALKMNLQRLRVNVKVTSDTGTVVETVFEGSSDVTKDYEVVLEDNAATHTISLTKLTQASPFGNGVGKLLTSVLTFHGVEMDAVLSSLPRPSRRVALIGASDTAGYCVDGTPETRGTTMYPWKYDNCHLAFPGLLGERLDAEISVQAMAGIGLTQNAFARMWFLLGGNTMPDYYDRALQTQDRLMEQDSRPDLVVVSLGGNDFNHQARVPDKDAFVAAYEEFLLQIAEPYEGEPVTIVSICGQGDPTEVARDPNNDRCRPCPHVQDAVESFRNKYDDDVVRAEYIFIPCDGTVVTGDGDIGCDGHKNRLGQEKVANFLEPRLREIMAWSEELDTIKHLQHLDRVEVFP